MIIKQTAKSCEQRTSTFTVSGLMPLASGLRLLLWTGLLLLLATGCARTAPEAAKSRPVEEIPSIKTMAVLPVSPLPPEGYDSDAALLREGAMVLDSLLAETFFEHQEQVSMVTEEQQQALAVEFPGSQQEMARLIGERLNADAVLQVVIERYFERQGTRFSVESPASVAFRFRLIQVASGRVICTGMFDEAQQPLTSDLFALPRVARRGFKWITAEALAEEGLQRELHKCEPLQPLLPGRRLLDKNNSRAL